MQKAGTTALDSMLREHPQISMAHVKEPHFFDDDSLDWINPNHSDYHRQFEPARAGIVVGESTPILTYWPRGMQRVAAYNPAARIIVCLRHPAFRAFSQWRMERMRDAEDLVFGDAIRNAGRSRLEAIATTHRTFSYVERGLYAPQIERIFEHFDASQIFFLRTDDLWAQTKRVLDDVAGFLGLDAFSGGVRSRDYRVSLDTRAFGSILAEDRVYLDRLFEDDLRRTSVLARMDLGDWFDPSYVEPMVAAPLGPAAA